MTSLYSQSYFCWEWLRQIFFFFFFAVDHTDYSGKQCIIYLVCIGIGM